MEENLMDFTLEQVALELVKLEKIKPSPETQGESVISIYESYVKKVYEARNNCYNNPNSP